MQLIRIDRRPPVPAATPSLVSVQPAETERDYPGSVTRPRILDAAIESLYAAFSAYPLDANTSPCLCCHPPDANDLLQAAPLRQLTWQHLSDFARDCLAVWGNLDDFKHFLPRMFDLVFSEAYREKDAPFPQAIFKKLADAHWHSWPLHEQASVNLLIQNMWEIVRSNPPQAGYIDVDQWIGSIAQCEDDLQPYLDQWMADERLSASWALSCLILGSPIAYTGPFQNRPTWTGNESREQIQKWFKLPHPNAYWESCGARYTQLQQWATSEAAIKKLESAELSCPDTEIRRELATAQRCIRLASHDNWHPVYRNRLFQSSHWQSASGRLY